MDKYLMYAFALIYLLITDFWLGYSCKLWFFSFVSAGGLGALLGHLAFLKEKEEGNGKTR